MFNFMQTKPYDEANEAMWDILPCLKLYPYDTCLQNFVARVTELSDPGKTGWALEVSRIICLERIGLTADRLVLYSTTF